MKYLTKLFSCWENAVTILQTGGFSELGKFCFSTELGKTLAVLVQLDSKAGNKNCFYL